ncbi:MAG: NapC/NirT family cytochrome c [Rhodanobacter sp.]|jgi:cytochrome c-type protein NapC|nr:NapC/NirT family cytochrome c [Rhodanobacter sp.]
MASRNPSEKADAAGSSVRRIGITSVLSLLLLGAVLTVSGKYALDTTNSLEFCTSCHEMRDNNFAEYRKTIHAANRTGVKAVCSDCHVPHGFFAVAKRKLLAANDIFHHLIGTEDTKEKFEAHRAELAKRVWQHMKETDSAECRYCHDVTAMDPEVQGPTAHKQHQKIGIDGKTCIDCHYGIAHKEPEGIDPSDLEAKP